MSRPASMEHLNAGDWERLREAAEQFERACRDQADVDLADFLPPPDDRLHRAILEELVITDLEMRRGRGQAVCLDYYLKKYPALGDARHLPARLIYEEYRIRRRFGEPLELEDYRQHYPDQFSELERLADQHSLPTDSQTRRDPPSELPKPNSILSPREGDLLAIGEGYRLIRFINRGMFGEVWRAEAPGGFKAAVKIIRRTLDSEEAQRELRALEVIKRLDHPHLLKTQAAWSLQDHLIILMDLADCTLRERLKECQKKGAVGIPVAELLRYFQEAAEALDYLHGEGVLHRDVKPQNLLLARDYIKVADFGLVRDQNQEHPAGGSMAGTPAYMAPEAWGGKSCAASDQYSLVLTYAELRVGCWPFKGMEPLLAHIEGTPDLSRLGEAERSVLLRGLAKRPAERFPNCRAMLAALRAALPGDPAEHDLVAPAFRPAPPTKQMRRIVTKEHAAAVPVPGDACQESFPDRSSLAGSPGDSLAASEALGRPTAAVLTPPEDGDLLVQTEELTCSVSPARAGGEGEAPGGHWKAASKRHRFMLWWTAVALFLLIVGGAVVWRVWPQPQNITPPPPTFVLREPQPRGALHPGDNETVSIHVDLLHGFREEVKLKASCDGLGLTFRVTDIPAGRDSGAVNVEVAPNAALGRRRVTVTATAEGQQQETSFPVVVLPPGFEPGPGKDIGPYPARIVRHVDKHDVVFVLVQPEGKQDAPFYLMENKVCNGVFRAFVREPGHKPAELVWRRGGLANGQDAGDHDLLPVFRVTRPEAEDCAAWLGGALPRAWHLDQAAGYYGRRDGRLGPARGPSVAVNRIPEGPRKIDEDSDDISLHGIRDLSGNGREWTRDTLPPVDGKSLAVLRGRSYTALGPLLFAHIDDWKKPDECPTRDPERASPYTGFRVVIELPGP